MSKRGPAWTEEQDDALRDGWGAVADAVLAQQLGRSVDAVSANSVAIGGGVLMHTTLITRAQHCRAAAYALWRAGGLSGPTERALVNLIAVTQQVAAGSLGQQAAAGHAPALDAEYNLAHGWVADGPVELLALHRSVRALLADALAAAS